MQRHKIRKIIQKFDVIKYKISTFNSVLLQISVSILASLEI